MFLKRKKKVGTIGNWLKGTGSLTDSLEEHNKTFPEMALVITHSHGTPAPANLLSPLKDHLPHSFAVLRRAQFTHVAQDLNQHAHFLFASASEDGRPHPLDAPNGLVDDECSSSSRRRRQGQHFAAAYLDLSQHPETEMFFYSTLQDLEDPSSLPDDEVEHVLDLTTLLFQRVRQVAERTVAENRHPLRRSVGVMVGNLHEATYRLLVERRGFASSYWNPHDVWLFRVEDLPTLSEDVMHLSGTAYSKDGLRWGVVRREDVPLIASRTKIPKVADTLMREPSVVVRDAEDRLVAWGFMGIAGTLSTLHVEVSQGKDKTIQVILHTRGSGLRLEQEPYRGKGIAKAIATKVMREHSFGDDGWGE